MIDAVDADQLHAVPDVGDGILLVHIAVHGQQIALLAGAGEHLAELARRIVLLVGIEPHPHDPLLVGQGLQKRRHGEFGAPIPQEAHDQLGADAETVLRVDLRPPEAPDHRVEGHAAGRVGLGVEEYLRIEHVLGAGLLQIGEGQVVKVGLLLQHLHAAIVQGQERRQVVEAVAGAHFRLVLERQLHAVASRQLELQLGLQRALDVHVQLALGHGLDEGIGSHRTLLISLQSMTETRDAPAHHHAAAAEAPEVAYFWPPPPPGAFPTVFDRALRAERRLGHGRGAPRTLNCRR